MVYFAMHGEPGEIEW